MQNVFLNQIKMTAFVFLFVMASLSGFSIAAQDYIEATPDVPRGFYAGLTTGRLYFLNENDRQVFEDAWLVGFKLGYDVWKYIGFETQLRFSGINASPQGESGVPESFLSYQLIANARGLYPVTRRVSLVGELGGGFWYTAPNQKANVGTQSRGMFVMGTGVQYFLKMKGFAMGIDPSLSAIQDLKGLVLQMTGYVRYTF